MATNIPDFSKKDFRIKRRGLSLATRKILESHPDIAGVLDKRVEKREFDAAVQKAYEAHRGSHGLNPELRNRKILRQAIADGKFLRGDSISAAEARTIRGALGMKKAVRKSEIGRRGSDVKNLPESESGSGRGGASRSGRSSGPASSSYPTRPRF